MGLYDRDYYGDSRGGPGRGGFGGGDGARRALSMLNASFPAGTYLGVAVRVHVTFLLLVFIELLVSDDHLWTLRWLGLLFVSVLLHEYGHCLGCRSVGGSADRILIWPLGGLAMCVPPRRPWPEFVTVACGPLVTLAIAAVCYIVLLIWFGSDTPVTLNLLARPLVKETTGVAAALVADLYIVNYVLLVFNLLLLFYPFDGGRLVQIAMWTRLGYVRSLRIACTMGMAGALVVAVAALAFNEWWVTLIAVFGFITCWQQQQHLRLAGEEFEIDTSAAWESGPARGARAARPGPMARWRAWREQRSVQREAGERAAIERRVDGILDKIHREGIGALSDEERRILRESSRRP